MCHALGALSELSLDADAEYGRNQSLYLNPAAALLTRPKFAIDRFLQMCAPGLASPVDQRLVCCCAPLDYHWLRAVRDHQQEQHHYKQHQQR